MPDMYTYKKEYFQFHHEVRTWMHPSKNAHEMSISEYNHLYPMKFEKPSPIKESPQDLLYYMNTNHYSQPKRDWIAPVSFYIRVDYGLLIVTQSYSTVTGRSLKDEAEIPTLPSRNTY